MAVPGSMGENITTTDLSDKSVFIGDIYSVGNVVLQVSQPRSPCWKINNKFNIDGLSMFIEKTAITGWYYRILQPGDMQVGDSFELKERINEMISIEHFVKIYQKHRPDNSDLDKLVACKGLNYEWVEKLKNRQSNLKKLMQ